MAIVTGNKIGKQIIDALGLPKNVTWLELRIATNEPVSIKCGYFPDDLKVEQLVEGLKEYELHEKEVKPA